MCIDNNKLLYLKPQTVKRKPVKITNMILQAELFFPEFWCTFYRASVERSVFCIQLGQDAFLTPSYYQFSGIHILKVSLSGYHSTHIGKTQTSVSGLRVCK